MKAVIATGVLFVAAALLSIAEAQWLKFPTTGVPRTPDGKPNLSAPAPKTPDGKPDFSGVWVTRAGYTGNIAKDLKPGEVSMQPWAAALYKHRQETDSREDPQAYCVLSGVPREHVVPYPFKILNSNGIIVILYEALHSYRQIYMDGRALPKDPNPAWMGYSIGHWEGDALVVQSSGFVDNNWLDNSGHPGTEAMRLTEKFRRPDFGHINLEMTIDDPKAYTRPWTVNLQFTASPDTDLIEYVCDENEKDLKHLVGK
ncbi:MAG TPA: hypothetical protein VHZ74_13340 [Bryobacteraceae bacterium]|jgi:hypothetical protein|nr:hypothetical protein [Bryobacteraceae bacterium]